MKKLLIVDGNSIINRAFYGIRPLSTSDGQPTNAIFGTVNILAKHIEARKPDYCAIAFDLREPTFRHEIFGDYKAGRRAMPEELAAQFDLAKECATALGFVPLSAVGYEADDILGTLARVAGEESNIKTYIVTGDRDSLQLIDSDTTVLLETNGGTVEFDDKKFIETYGVEPGQFVDIKALMGDSSDNIPGVPGIGEKTALKLISEYGSISAIYERLDSSGTDALPGVTPSLRAKLETGRESALLSRRLAEIEKNVPLDLEFDSLKMTGLNRERARELFLKLEFSAFIKRFGLDAPVSEAERLPEITEIDARELAGISAEEIVFDYSGEESAHFVIYDGRMIYKYSGSPAPLGDFLEGRRVICYDCKRLYKILSGMGVHWRGCSFDVMLAAYVVNSSDSSFELPRLIIEYLGGICDENIPDAVSIMRLSVILDKAVKESGQAELMNNIELPLAGVLADMELSGFRIDLDGIREYGVQLDAVARELEERIYYLAGGEFNINSPKQLSEILFVRLGLPNSKKTKTGFSTSAEVLEKLRGHPIIEDILDYRKVTKLKSTYVEGLLRVADQNSRVHTNFKQTGTATGRLSSTEPNLQNIPIRTELGRELRRFFVPRGHDYLLVDADYSQIELRLLASVSQDENMISAFLSGEDIHTSTAATVFGVSPSEVTPELRKRAKAVNFGIMYGIGEYSLSQDLGISVASAKHYIEGYLASFPQIDEYLKDTIKKAYESGYVTTMFGRRRYITELKAQNRNMRAFGERVAMNSPIQGTAADIIKIAMINVSRRLRESGIDARLILQVHDELLIEANRNCAEVAREILREEMERAAVLRVPLLVDVSMGETWLDCK